MPGRPVSSMVEVPALRRREIGWREIAVMGGGPVEPAADLAGPDRREAGAGGPGGALFESVAGGIGEPVEGGARHAEPDGDPAPAAPPGIEEGCELAGRARR